MTRADRPPENTIDEFVAFIDKLMKTMDPEADDDTDCPTEKMEFLETKELRRNPSRAPTETERKRRSTPPPPPPADDPSYVEFDLFEDSLMPTEF